MNITRERKQRLRSAYLAEGFARRRFPHLKLHECSNRNTNKEEYPWH
jgi:hypothetical protein